MIMYPSLALLSRKDLQELTPSEIRVLQYSFDVMRIRKRNITIKHLYITPGRKIIAEKTGRCVTTVSRATTSLMKKGLLWKTQRRKVRGIWQTCLYRLGDRILQKIPWIWKKIKNETKKPCDKNITPRDVSTKDSFSKELFSIKELIAMMGFPGFSP